jgi:hypothetical protein
MSLENLELTHVVCPECNCLVMVENVRAVGDPFSGIVYGYFLGCDTCNEVSFINYLGKPPLFDLSGRYSNLGTSDKGGQIQ